MYGWYKFLCLLFCACLGMSCAGAPVQMGITTAEQALGVTIGSNIQAAVNGTMKDSFIVRSLVDTRYFVIGWYESSELFVVLMDTKVGSLLDIRRHLDAQDMRALKKWSSVMQFTRVQIDEAKIALCEGAILAKNWLAQYTSLAQIPILVLPAGSLDDVLPIFEMPDTAVDG